MASEKLYTKIPEANPYRGDDKELRKIIDNIRHAIALLKSEIKRLQEEKADG